MTLREFIDLCVSRLAPLYPEPEAKAIGFRLLEFYLEIPSYKCISDPDFPILSDNVDEATDPAVPSRADIRQIRHDPSRQVRQDPSRHARLDRASEMLEALDELTTGRPLQYVLSFTEFCGRRFKVGEGCLIPRPETEELVSRIIEDLCSEEDVANGDTPSVMPGSTPSVMPGSTPSVMPGLTGHLEAPVGEPFNILDICTGSGCIAWSLAAEFPDAMVYGCDLSDAALRYACRQRIKLHGARPIFFTADVLADPPAGLPQFDVIVANPPYICDSERAAMRPNVLNFEPAEALFVPDDDPLKYYRAIARWASALLRRPAAATPDATSAATVSSETPASGRIYLEINERFGPDVAALFPGSRILQDVSGRDRFVVLP